MEDISAAADKMGPEFFNRKLQDEVRLFTGALKIKKKDMKKSELVSLINYLVAYPDVQTTLPEHIRGLAELATNAKDCFVALTVQVLIEEGQRQSDKQNKPTFKGEQDGK